ncbi:MAG: DUF2235 domain-containing protein [Mariprofundus sp.]|nr:DUF2235 domain-containing protein [Mariprofundus sp.]
MAKNIIVCADGTGNQGGTTPDSNVYKMYKAIDKRFKGTISADFECDEQIVFYDNGVGTEKNKYLRALGGGMGFGFKDNVCDLYEFLARNYEDGDRIYFFGFSRGASTVRACNGFISKCGLLKGKGLHNYELKALIKEAFEAYKVHKGQPSKAESLRKDPKHNHGVVPVCFLGVWDTVVALGLPKRTDITGPVSAAINAVFFVAEKILDLGWSHSFYYYKLTGNVEHAYQGLAIDDERTAFFPFVWNEHGRDKGVVEQVWFAGMHSNVGGGYGRSGMASVALHWMMLRAQKSGLQFEASTVQQALDDSHVHGRMYDSRDGAGVIYRYHPRDLECLCSGRLNGDIKLHRSVIERLEHRSGNYAPGQLPENFEVVEDDPNAAVESRHPGKDPTWQSVRAEIDQWVLRRKGLYALMISFVLTVFVMAYNAWVAAVDVAHVGLLGDVADILDYFLPEFLEPLVDATVIQHPFVLGATALLIVVYMKVRAHCRARTVEACERLRHLVIHEADK